MRERLVEDWLDRINERGYQAAFCHWLAWRGFTIVHNTRHTPIEFGKDVVARGPDGALYAFQLKGDPGSRMSFKDWQSLQPQVITLVTHLWPGPETEQASSYIPVLVTNGEVDEDARAAIQQFNSGPMFAGKVQPLQIWARGELLAGFLELGSVSWPKEVGSLRHLLNAIASSGTALPDFEALHALLSSELADVPQLGNAEAVRRVLSTLLVVEIFIGSAQRQENHFAVLAYRAMARTYVIAALSLRVSNDATTSLAPVLLAIRNDIVASIRLLLVEAKDKEKDGVFIDSSPMTDFVNYDFRALLLFALFAVDALDRVGREDQDDWVIDRILNQRRPLTIWGEASIPQHLAIYWLHRCRSGATDSDARLLGLLKWILKCQLDRDRAGNLPISYYGIEQILERNYRQFLSRGQLPIDRDSSFAASSFALPITRMVAALNWKQTLKFLWPSVSRIALRYTEPSCAAAYLRFEDENSTEVLWIQNPEQQWDALLADARDQPCSYENSLLWGDAPMMLLHVVLFPHRATPEAIRHLDANLWDAQLRLRATAS